MRWFHVSWMARGIGIGIQQMVMARKNVRILRLDSGYKMVGYNGVKETKMYNAVDGRQQMNRKKKERIAQKGGLRKLWLVS
jgi:hypothetical protein